MKVLNKFNYKINKMIYLKKIFFNVIKKDLNIKQLFLTSKLYVCITLLKNINTILKLNKSKDEQKKLL